MSDVEKTGSAGVDWLASRSEPEAARPATALVIAWSAVEPRRIGEVALFGDAGPPRMLGRGGAEEGDELERVTFVRQRPGHKTPCPPIQGPAISRDQLLLEPLGNGELRVVRVGQCGVLINGASVDAGVLRPGETLELRHQLLLYCTRRTMQLPSLTSYRAALHPFGGSDPYGIVGESPACWELRDGLAFAASSHTHVLLLGESGAGKELAAQAIHGLSPRGARPLIARNAATFPPGIIDAELFGNVKNYPNPGMDERPGVIGQADGSTLFLDELAELPADLQAHLLRVLDTGGEYQRLGDARPRRADLRVIAATNRDPSELKHDLLARFPLRVSLPGVPDRREDVPLLLRHLLGAAAIKNPQIGARFFDDPAEAASARVDPALVAELLRHRHRHHVRELESLLWRAISSSRGSFIARTDAVAAELEVEQASGSATGDDEPSRDAIVHSLARHDGKVSRAWPDLGLKSRYALYRLMKKHGIGNEEGGEDASSATAEPCA